MSYQQNLRYFDGQILTGRLWRKRHFFFNDLPFYSNITRMDDMAGPIQKALGDGMERYYSALMVVS